MNPIKPLEKKEKAAATMTEEHLWETAGGMMGNFSNTGEGNRTVKTKKMEECTWSE